MARILIFNKPYGVLSQFTPEGRWQGLKDYLDLPGVYPAGRLDADSEGLLLLTDDGALQARIADPRYKLEKTYWVQVEGMPTEAALQALRQGVALKDGVTRPAQARLMEEPPGLWQREPPIRYRAAIPTAWIELKIREGKNRQVRRMTASVGYPTLRLIRAAIGRVSLDGLATGAWRLTQGGFADLAPEGEPLPQPERRPRPTAKHAAESAAKPQAKPAAKPTKQSAVKRAVKPFSQSDGVPHEKSPAARPDPGLRPRRHRR